MALATQTTIVAAASGKETGLDWFITTDEGEFRNRPVREGEVKVFDRSALVDARRTRSANFRAAQIEGQKVYKR